jgi:formylglycine-generating enzyme required for sulfatase activity
VSSFADTSDVGHIVSINGGTFLMGTTAGDIRQLKNRYDVRFPGVFENEIPAHEVTVKAAWFRSQRQSREISGQQGG